VIDISPDGKVLIPLDPLMSGLCGAMGDDGAYMACEQARLVEIIIGDRACG
jgi:hypothetical protein